MKSVQNYIISEVLSEDQQTVLLRARRGEHNVLIRHPAGDYPTSEQCARLEYGAGIMRSLALPSVVQVHEVERRDGSLLVILEDFGGQTLRKLLDSRKLDVRRSLEIALALANSLGEIHNRHVIHQAIEPSTILVNPESGEVKLTGFEQSSQLTRDNPVGTHAWRRDGRIAYLSPEQTGRMNRSVDYRTDFYSLGVTLYEMLTGQVPFRGADPLALVHNHIAVAPTPPEELRPELPAPVSKVVLKLLAKNAEDRYQSAYGLVADLKKCLALLDRGQSADTFVPGLEDAPATFRLPQKLYGREREKELLISAFERASTGPAETVLVSGYSGVGKSALVNEVHKPIARLRGAFSSGKFDQLQNVPYSALIQAFQKILRDLLSSSEEEVALLRMRLTEALGSNGQVLIEVIPEVELIIGPQPAVPALGAGEAQNRFKLIFLQFVSALAREQYPIALFLDDIQWADSASLALLQHLLQDTKIHHLLLIGAYRENEIHGAHPLALWLTELRKTPARVSEIALRPLALGEVTELVADTLDRKADEECAALASLVFQKTEGNPFFVNQFLTSLHERKLLTFDTGGGRWRWSLERIQQEGITANVAHLMAEKILRLPERTRQVLQLAACIGNSFELTTLAVVHEHSPRDTANDLWKAIQEGLVLPIGDEYKYVTAGAAPEANPLTHVVRYQFLHDRVQEAAYALISATARKETHLRVGRLLLSNAPEERLEARIFDIVNQLNIASELITDPAERRRLAQLNLLAGRKAKDSTAYEAAARYLTAGTELLTEESFQGDYELAFALHRHLAECDYLLGRPDEAETAFERLLSKATSTHDKRALQVLRIALYMSRGKHEHSMRAGIEGLRLEGIQIDLGDPAELGAACEKELELLRSRLEGRDISELASLPDATDPEERQRGLLRLQLLGFGSYTNPVLFQYLAMKTINLSLERGATHGTALGFMAYAMRVGVADGDWPRAHQFGRVALALSNRLDDAQARALVTFYFGCFVNPWHKSMRSSLPYLEQAYVGCLESGALFIAAVAGLMRVLQGMHASEELGALHERAHKQFDFLVRLRQFDQAYMIAAHLRTFQLLREGAISDPQLEWLQPDFLIKRLEHFPMAGVVCNVSFLFSAFLLDDLPAALGYAEKAEAGMTLALGHPQELGFRFYQSLLLTTVLGTSTPEEAEPRRKQLDSNLEKMARWADSGPENTRHRLLLVRAEVARLAAQDREAAELYDRAIELAGENDFTSEQAIANELAGRFYLSRGRRKLARAYLLDARQGYARWGAKAKVARLEAQYPELLPRTSPAPESEAGQGALSLDLTSVLKASQAISEEIVLEDLLKKLLSTLLESAGAQRGMLVLRGELDAVVEAHKTAKGSSITMSFAGLENRTDVALSIVRYVERTHEPLVLGDAANEGQFQADAYIKSARPKSLLCMPVRKQKKLLGVVYLENNLATEAFTPERCRVLELLAAQAAISIENARLYDTLDNRVRQRTQQLHESNKGLARALERLKETQQQLITQEKLASLGMLTSGIAHEIKNPLNFVNNFAKLAVGIADELLGEIEQHASRLPTTTTQYLRELTGDLKLNTSKIYEHGTRADGIVKAMLEHSRTSKSEQQETDLNELVREYSNLAYHSYQSQEGSSELNIDVEYDPSLDTLLLAPQEIGRVVLNLLSNAFHAAQAKVEQARAGYAPRVRIVTKNVDNAVEIRVWDNGIGIPSDARPKLFTPFFTTKPPGKGTGLGLSISHDIVVQRNGGKLRFDTEVGEYSEFVVILPKHRA